MINQSNQICLNNNNNLFTGHKVVNRYCPGGYLSNCVEDGAGRVLLTRRAEG